MSEAASALSGSVTTLRRWKSSGKLVSEPTAGGSRRYDLAKLKPEISVRKQMANAAPLPTPVFPATLRKTTGSGKRMILAPETCRRPILPRALTTTSVVVKPPRRSRKQAADLAING